MSAVSTESGKPTLKPNRKVRTGAVAGTLAGLAVWAVNRFVLDDALPDIILVYLGTLVTILTTYLVRPAPDEGISA